MKLTVRHATRKGVDSYVLDSQTSIIEIWSDRRIASDIRVTKNYAKEMSRRELEREYVNSKLNFHHCINERNLVLKRVNRLERQLRRTKLRRTKR